MPAPSPSLPTGFSIGQMREDELATLEGWAASEGWNPGLSDLRVAWAADPDCFVALREADTLAGGGSIISYGGRYGFMGLFIMRAQLRKQGLGTALWHWRRDALRARLAPGSAIGMDGVFDMVPFYERGGFRKAYRDLRFQGVASGERAARVVTLTASDFAEIERYDRAFVPAPRAKFLGGWLGQPGASTLGIREDGRLVGYGVSRPCRTGHKIGPLFADTPAMARDLLSSLMSGIAGQQVQIDMPEPNADALALAQAFGLNMSFGCVKLYHGPPPALPIAHIYGVTSLEFG